jgi:hypothetical protein
MSYFHKIAAGTVLVIASIRADKSAHQPVSIGAESEKVSALIKLPDKSSKLMTVSSDQSSQTSVEFNFDSADAAIVRKAVTGGIPPVSTSIREASTVATAKKMANTLYDGRVELVPLGDSGNFTLKCYKVYSNSPPYVEYTFSRSRTPQDSNPLEYRQKAKWNPFRNARKARIEGLPENALPGRDRVFRKFCDHFSNEYQRILLKAKCLVPADSVFVLLKRSSKTNRDFVTMGDSHCKFELYVNELDDSTTQVALDEDKVRRFFNGCEVERPTTPTSITLGEITVNTLFGSTWVTCSHGVSATPFAAYTAQSLKYVEGFHDKEIKRDIHGVWESRYASGDFDAGVNRREFEIMDDKETQVKLEDICHWLWKKTNDIRDDALRT